MLTGLGELESGRSQESGMGGGHEDWCSVSKVAKVEEEQVSEGRL